jgi:hypothetical protein
VDNQVIENKNIVSTASTQTNTINRAVVDGVCLNSQSNENKNLILIVKIKNNIFKLLSILAVK